jgi:hypothetical protein
MAGPFARLRRGDSSEPTPDAPTETQDDATAEAPAVDADATTDAPALDADATTDASALDADAADADATADAAAADATEPGEPAPTTEQPVVAEQPTATEATDAPASDEPQPPADTLPGDETPGFIERGKLRRRLRFVRRARELALRDLGGLVFDLHRFGRERSDLVDQKLAALATLDSEMRALQALLDDHPEVTVLHEPGLASCPRCGALHASDAAYCSACGLPVGQGADLPSGPALAGPVPPTPAAAAAATAPRDQPTEITPPPASADTTAPVDQPTEITPPPASSAEAEPDPANPADVPLATEAVPEDEPQEHPTTAS